MTALRVLLLIAVLAGDAVLIYISSLYAPTWFWIVAYGVLIGAAVYGLSRRGNAGRLWLPAGIGALIINAHYLTLLLSAAFSSGSNFIQGLGWSVGLLVGQFFLLFIILTLGAKITQPKLTT